MLDASVTLGSRYSHLGDSCADGYERRRSLAVRAAPQEEWNSEESYLTRGTRAVARWRAGADPFEVFLFAHPPMSPICRTPLFPYPTFYSCVLPIRARWRRVSHRPMRARVGRRARVVGRMVGATFLLVGTDAIPGTAPGLLRRARPQPCAALRAARATQRREHPSRTFRGNFRTRMRLG